MSRAGAEPEVLTARAQRVRDTMSAANIDALLLSLGADLPWLTGYAAMPLERLTMLVFPADDHPTLVVPELEAPRVRVHESVFSVRAWRETEDPIELVTGLVGARMSLAISDRAWASSLVALTERVPRATWRAASTVTGPLRAIKDAGEIAALARAAAAADRVATQLLAGEIALVGRTEATVSADIGRRMIDEGHDRVNFAIVGAGPNAASPHHDAGPRVIEPGDPVVCDFGGTMGGYCSDITRTVVAGGLEPPGGFAEVYEAVRLAQGKGVAAAVVGTPCERVDAAARGVIADAGFGPPFIHRTGHGIGLEEHEDPYIVAGNGAAIAAGHAFSIEPGIYLPGRYGVRIEDIVVATVDGPRSLNTVDHALHVVDA